MSNIAGPVHPENERRDAVKRLLDDGLSVSDIADLAPTLLGSSTAEELAELPGTPTKEEWTITLVPA